MARLFCFRPIRQSASPQRSLRATAYLLTGWLLVGALSDSLSTNAALGGATGSVAPKWSQATLRRGDHTWTVRRARQKNWPMEWIVGDLLIQADDDHIRASHIDTGKVLWKQARPDAALLRLSQFHDGVLYLAAERSRSPFKEGVDGRQCVVRRIELKQGTRLKELVVPLSEDEHSFSNRIMATLPMKRRIIVLSVSAKKEVFAAQPVSYRVTCFDPKSGEAVWSNSFTSSGGLPSPGAVLLGTLGPARDSAAISGLTRCDEQVLVCAGPRENLMMLDPRTGKTVWKIARLWEYRRGFIGPSVWRHFMGRYGVDDRDVEVAALTVEQLREKNKKEGFYFNEEYFQELKDHVAERRKQVENDHDHIVAGPVVVHTSDEPRSERIFVAVARSPQAGFSSYLANCVIYELDGSGGVLGRVVVPHFVRGSTRTVRTGSVFWFTKKGLARFYGGRGWQPVDCVVAMDYRTERESPKRSAWLRQGGRYHPVAFYDRWALLVREGGYLEKRDSQEMRFPFVIRDLETGEEQEATISLPFSGRIRPPKNNYSSTISLNGRSWVAHGSFYMMLKDIQVASKTVIFTFEFGGKEHVLEFDWPAVFAKCGHGVD